MLDTSAPRTLPAAAGLGYKAQHFAGLMADPGPVAWLEIHAENYMGAGGRPLAQLRALAGPFPRLGPWRGPVDRRRRAT
jgi:uncharacterized protein